MSIRGKWKQDGLTGNLIPYVEPEKNATFHIKNDEMPPTQHPITGEWFTSKKKFRAVTRALGYEETGNDRRKSTPKEHLDSIENIKEDAERAYYMVRDGMAPLTEKDKELCRQENERLEKTP